MKPATHTLALLCLTCLCISCAAPDRVELKSPDGRLRIELLLEAGKPFYRVYAEKKEIIGKSALGFEGADGSPALADLRIAGVEEKQVDAEWTPVYGEKSRYPDRYHEARVRFAGDAGADWQVELRAYNEGLAFRYVFDGPGGAEIARELTEFSLPDTARVWASERAQSPIENLPISALKEAVERPLLAQLGDSLFVALGEAALVDFARMKFVRNETRPGLLRASLEGTVAFPGPFTSPWRTVMIEKTAGKLLENNYLMLNLNEASRIENTDWIRPGKVIREVTLTTQGGRACVDFAASHGLQYIEFDAGWYGNEYDENSDATTVTVDPKRSKGPLDLPAVIEYANSKGIGVILYVNRRALETQLDALLPLYQSWGVKGLKYGFVNVGPQEWTSWMHEAVRKAAAHQLLVDIHDEYRPTGYSRTYPNLLTQEGIRGDEESPDNTQVLNTLFTRMLAGAGDHTNCYFAPRVREKMGSHASQLAKAVCVYSPWQFLYWYDRPVGSPPRAGGAGSNEEFITEVPELAFFAQLPTVWDDTRVLEGYPGEYAVIARRSGKDWYIGALNGSENREFAVPLHFLDPALSYEAQVYTDDPGVATRTQVGVEIRRLSARDTIRRPLGRHQGFAVLLRGE